MKSNKKVQKSVSPSPTGSPVETEFQAGNEGGAQVGSMVNRAMHPNGRLTSSDVLHLQRTIGNRAVNRLIQENKKNTGPHNPGLSRPALAPSGKGSFPIQRKVFLGDTYQPYTRADAPEAKLNTMAADDKTRRFKDEAELKAFAAGQKDNMAYADSLGHWIRLDQPFIVLGEDHGNPYTVMSLVASLNTTRYRHEGFTHFSATRLKNNQSLRTRVAATKKEKVDKYGMATKEDSDDHSGEHALPKIARSLADVKEMVRLQIANQPVPNNGMVTPGTRFAEDYGLPKTLNHYLIDGLIYARSYGTKVLPNKIKSFYKQNQAQIDTAIAELEAKDATNTIPNYNSLAFVSGGGLDKMIELYATAGMDKVGLGSKAKVDAWKAKLNTKGETRVTIGDKAKELDYVRDKSLYDNIKKAKSKNDLVFGVGDAHRYKLAPLLQSEGIPSKELNELLKEEKAKDEVAVTKTDNNFPQKLSEEIVQHKNMSENDLFSASSDYGDTVVKTKAIADSMEWDWTDFESVTRERPGLKAKAVTPGPEKQAKFRLKLKGRDFIVREFTINIKGTRDYYKEQNKAKAPVAAPPDPTPAAPVASSS